MEEICSKENLPSTKPFCGKFCIFWALLVSILVFQAVLVGILSTNQYESLDQGRGSGISNQVNFFISKNLDQTPDDFARRCFIELLLEIEFQVVSRIVPVMPWIREHVDHEDHLCFKDNTDKKEKIKDKKG